MSVVEHKRTRVPGKIDSKVPLFSFPPLLEDLRLWLEARFITGLSDSDAIETWNDNSGLSNNASQATLARRPRYKTNVINSLPAARFDSTDDGMSTSLSIANPYFVFVIYRQNDANAPRRAVQGSNNWLMGPYTNGPYNNHLAYNGDFLSGPAVSIGSWVYASMNSTTAGAVLRVNGNQVATNTNLGVPGTFHLGNGGGWNERLGGDIAAVIACAKNQSSENILKLEAYFKKIYAL